MREKNSELSNTPMCLEGSFLEKLSVELQGVAGDHNNHFLIFGTFSSETVLMSSELASCAVCVIPFMQLLVCLRSFLSFVSTLFCFVSGVDDQPKSAEDCLKGAAIFCLRLCAFLRALE